MIGVPFTLRGDQCGSLPSPVAAGDRHVMSFLFQGLQQFRRLRERSPA